MAGKRTYTLNESFFEAIDTEPKAYWLGFLAADGCIYKYPEGTPGRRAGYGCLVVNLQSRDGSHLAKLLEALESSAPLREILSNGKHPQKRLLVSSRRLIQDLIRHGLTPRKTLALKPWKGPAELMPHYWRGLIDGDGCWHHGRSGQWVLKLAGSRLVLQAFRQFVIHNFHKPGHCRRQGNSWALAYTGLGFLQALAQLLYTDATVFLERKQALAEQLLATELKIKSWKHVTRRQLEDLYALHGQWQRVALALGIPESHLFNLKNRFGMPNREQDWSWLTGQEILRLYAESKDWQKVAEQLGTERHHLVRLRKRLGVFVKTWRWQH